MTVASDWMTWIAIPDAFPNPILLSRLLIKSIPQVEDLNVDGKWLNICLLFLLKSFLVQT